MQPGPLQSTPLYSDRWGLTNPLTSLMTPPGLTRIFYDPWSAAVPWRMDLTSHPHRYELRTQNVPFPCVHNTLPDARDQSVWWMEFLSVQISRPVACDLQMSPCSKVCIRVICIRSTLNIYIAIHAQ